MLLVPHPWAAGGISLYAWNVETFFIHISFVKPKENFTTDGELRCRRLLLYDNIDILI